MEQNSGDTKPSLERRVVDGEEAVSDLSCGICLSIVQNPKQCQNGHLFCEPCILRSLKTTQQCPSCRCPLSVTGLSRSLFVEKTLRSLLVWCTYRFKKDEGGEWVVDEEGCQHSCAYEESDAHELECGYAWVNCNFSKKCGHRRKDCEKHAITCNYRPLECEYCHLDIQSKRLQGHMTKCTSAPISCPQCQERLRRGDVTHHLQRLCPEQLLMCPYKCDQMVQRKHLKEHLQENVVEHLEQLRASFSKTLEDIQLGYQAELKKREDEIQALKSKVKNEIRLQWDVKDWKKCMQGKYSQSRKQELGGLTWFLGLYGNGDSPEAKGYLSLYLFLASPMEKGNTVHTKVRLTIVNRINPLSSVHKDITTTFPALIGQGWGERKLVRNSAINDTLGFVLEDCVKVEAEITFLKFTYTL